MLKTCAVTPRKRPWFYYLKRDKFFYLLLALPILYYIVYKYMPMFGIVIAFHLFLRLVLIKFFYPF